MKSTIDRLIINSPYEEPAHYWSYDRETRFFTLKDKTKSEFLDEWVKAVNQHRGSCVWKWSVSKDLADVAEILEKADEA